MLKRQNCLHQLGRRGPRRRLRSALVALAASSSLFALFTVSSAHAASTSSTPTANPTASAASSLVPGMNLGGLNYSIVAYASQAQQDQTLQALAASGIRSLRLDVPFSAVEPQPGNWQAPMLPFIKEALKYGIGIEALLDYPPVWALMADGQPSPSAYAQYAQRTAQVLAPLGIHTYELENEPNRPAVGTVNVGDYTQLLKATYPAIKAADPASTVLVGGLADASDAPAGTMMSPATFVTDVYADGGKGSFDGIAVHPESAPVGPMAPASWNAFYNLPQLHAISVNHGDPGDKVWITEYGSPTAGTPENVSASNQATFAVQAYQQAEQWPWIGGFYWFEWQDHPQDGGDWGITAQDGTPKPALNAIRSLLGEPTSDSPVPVIPAG